ncbi:MAG: DNA recombination protein RmuC [Caldimicrobium sp.]
MKEIFFIILLFSFIFLVLLTGFLWIYYKLRSYFESRLSEPIYILRERLNDLTEIRREVQKLYLTEEILKNLKEEILKISHIFIGRKSGQSAERALEEALSLLPDHLLKRNLKIGGGEVEFALKVEEDRYLPIDSKFIKPELLQKEKLLPEEERELIRNIRQRAKELSPYLRDERGIGIAIMACPDGLFPFLQRRIFEDLEKEKILLVPYSLLLSVLLFIHFLWDRFYKKVDEHFLAENLANLEKFLFELERDLEKLGRELKSAENLLAKISEAHKLLKREYQKLRGYSQSSNKSKDISE